MTTRATRPRAKTPSPVMRPAMLPLLFAEAPRSGRNHVVWHGPAATAEQIVAAVREATGQTVHMVWRLSMAGWQAYVPGQAGYMVVDTRDSLVVELS